MGCKLSIRVQPFSPKYVHKKKRNTIRNTKDVQIDIISESDSDSSYQTLYIDTPPDSERKYV